MKKKEFLSSVMCLAWQFVKRNGLNMSEALKVAWRNGKLKIAMKSKIVKFYYQKVDGTMREAYGTLSDRLMPATGNDNRKKNDTVQVYYDTECQEWRCFKKANLVSVV
jgi:hypothetical protein